MRYEAVPTTCPYCGCGCGLFLQVLDGHLVGVLPSKTHPVSRGSLCIKGWNCHTFVESHDRLKTPLVRGSDGELHPATWEEALTRVAEEMAGTAMRHGPDSVAVLSSARCTNEENYLMQKLARAVLGTNNVDHCARLCHASTVSGLAHSFGSGAMTNSIDDVAEAGCILVTGSNTIEQHPLIGTRLLLAKEGGARIIVVDPRETPLSAFADMHLRQRPGSDVAWLNGMMHVILRDGLEAREFIEKRTEGFEELRRVVERYTPEEASRISGIPAADIESAARMFATAPSAAILYSMGITQHTHGTDNVKSVANLAMLTGNVGRRGSGVNPLRGQSNVQGSCDMGALPNVYPGYQPVADEAVRRRFEAAWGRELPARPGLTVVEITTAAREGRIKAMLIMGENVMVSDPDLGHVREALEELDFLAVIDIFPNETTAFADVVLPACSWAEKDGTFTGTDRRVQRIRRAIAPLGESRPDWQVLCELGRRMGGRGFDFASPEAVMEEAASLTPQYGGVRFARLREGGLQWPCPTLDHPGTPVLHTKAFTRGRGLFSAVEYRPPAEEPDADYPLVLTTGRVMFQYHTGTQTRRTPRLEQEVPTGYVEVNPADAEAAGVRDGGRVKVRSRRGAIELPAKVTGRVPRGVVFIPFHFAECAANVLTNAALDPVAKIPELKVCAVAMEPVGTEGGGSGGA